MGPQAPGSLFSALSPLTCESPLPLQVSLLQDHLLASLFSLLWVSSEGTLLGEDWTCSPQSWSPSTSLGLNPQHVLSLLSETLLSGL